MKKVEKCILWFSFAMITVLALILLIFQIIDLNAEITPVDIYNDCLYNVIEVKAEKEGIGASYGTGEVIASDGTIVTNAHVVTYTRLKKVYEFEYYYVRFSYEENYRAVSLINYDLNLDIAILKILDDSDLIMKPIKIGNSDKLKSGEYIYAVGNAANSGIGIFKGMISMPKVNVVYDGHMRNVIQCDLTLASGNSGGALLNEKGELVGITTFRIKDNSGNIVYGIAYCVPINTVIEYINKIQGVH